MNIFSISNQSRQKWTILEDTMFGGWAPTFTVHAEHGPSLMVFDTEDEAADYLREHLEEARAAVEEGFMTDVETEESFRIMPVTIEIEALWRRSQAL